MTQKFLCNLAYKPTNKQTDRGENMTSLVEEPTREMNIGQMLPEKQDFFKKKTTVYMFSVFLISFTLCGLKKQPPSNLMGRGLNGSDQFTFSPSVLRILARGGHLQAARLACTSLNLRAQYAQFGVYYAACWDMSWGSGQSMLEVAG